MSRRQPEPGTTRLFMSAINVGQVYYFLHKPRSEKLAEAWRDSSRTLPLTFDATTTDQPPSDSLRRRVRCGVGTKA
jgi:hypothetical protein